MEKVFEAKQQLMSALGWGENPFVKDLRLENRDEFLKFYCPFESASMLKRLAFDTKACILLGPKGVGKTSALHYVMYSLPKGEFVTFFFKQPPESLDELAAEIGAARRGIVHRIRSMLSGGKPKGATRAQIAQRVKYFDDRKVVFFVDEAHLLRNPDMYMELKYLLDELPDLRMVLCALGKESFPDSLLNIVGEGNVFYRNKFSEKEMRQIVGHRIAAVGGSGLLPFDSGFLDKTFTEQNLLSPRYVFDELNNYLADLALDENRMERLRTRKPKIVSVSDGAQIAGATGPAQTISPDLLDLEKQYEHDTLVAGIIAEAKSAQQKKSSPAGIVDADEEVDAEGVKQMAASGALEPKPAGQTLSFLTTMHAEWWVQLSPSQQQILSLLLQSQAGLTLAQIMAKTGLSQNTAFNALYQLRGDDRAEIARKPEVPFPLISVKKQVVGRKKRNIYFANEKIRNIFTMS
jgi:DNA-binding CsgD family transcriptional regulator